MQVSMCSIWTQNKNVNIIEVLEEIALFSARTQCIHAVLNYNWTNTYFVSDVDLGLINTSI
jgi:hypothetical protein